MKQLAKPLRQLLAPRHGRLLAEFGLLLVSGNAVKPMDERIESFLADVLALLGEDENVVRDGVRVALADYEQIFRAKK